MPNDTTPRSDYLRIAEGSESFPARTKKSAKAAKGAETWDLKKAVWQCRRHTSSVIAFSAAHNLLFLAPSIYLLQVYDRVLSSGSIHTLVFLSIGLAICLSAMAILDGARMHMLLALSKRLDRLLAPEILRASLDGRRRSQTGQSQLLREFDTFRAAISGPAALAVIDLPWAPIYIAVCFVIHPAVGALALIGGVVLVGLAFTNHAFSRRDIKESEQRAGAMYSLQLGDVANDETAAALGMRDALVRRQLDARSAMTASATKAGQSGAIYTSLTKFVRIGLQSGAIALGAYLALHQEISAGAIIAASIITSRAFAPLELVVGAWRQIEQGRLAFRAINSALKAEGAGSSQIALPSPKALVRAEGLSINAGDRSLIAGASFQVSPGDIVAVIGPSGAGKTTLLKALAGAIQPDAGVVRLDGARLCDWRPEEIGRHVGYMPQETALFAGSITENVSRFEEEHEPGRDAEIVLAAQAAGVHELILSLPQGYATRIGQHGRGLSAGQAQRVALARAFYRSPALIVLDEPDAHLDTDGEAALAEALRAASRREACCIVAAHRPALINVANKVLLLRNGRVEGYGPRDQVLAVLNKLAQSKPAVSSITKVVER